MFETVLLDDAPELLECGEEHPRLEGNYCVNQMDHEDEHEDLAGNQWTGRNY